MKKIASILSLSAFALLVACGPNAADKEAAEKKKADSIAAAEKAQREADSLANIARVDSLAAVAKADSTRRADSLAAIKSGPRKNTGGSKTSSQDKKDAANINKLNDIRGGDAPVKTPEQVKKDKENLNKLKNLRGGN